MKAIKTICSWPGCRCVVDMPERYCLKHKEKAAQRREVNRLTAHQRGYNSEWRRARALFLSDHPICEECKREGKASAATVVDHIVPHKGNKALFWDESNWQALCKHCHDVKTAKEDGGFGNERRNRR